MHIDVVSKALSKLVHWSYMLLIRPASQEFPRNPGESNSVSSEAQLEARNPNRPMKGCRMLLAFRIIQYSATLRSMADLAIQLLNSHTLPSQNCLIKLVWLIISPNEMDMNVHKGLPLRTSQQSCQRPEPRLLNCLA